MYICTLNTIIQYSQSLAAAQLALSRTSRCLYSVTPIDLLPKDNIETDIRKIVKTPSLSST